MLWCFHQCESAAGREVCLGARSGDERGKRATCGEGVRLREAKAKKQAASLCCGRREAGSTARVRAQSPPAFLIAYFSACHPQRTSFPVNILVISARENPQCCVRLQLQRPSLAKGVSSVPESVSAKLPKVRRGTMQLSRRSEPLGPSEKCVCFKS